MDMIDQARQSLNRRLDALQAVTADIRRGPAGATRNTAVGINRSHYESISYLITLEHRDVDAT